jgi:hypothetical protein
MMPTSLLSSNSKNSEVSPADFIGAWFANAGLKRCFFFGIINFDPSFVLHILTCARADLQQVLQIGTRLTKEIALSTAIPQINTKTLKIL